MDSSIANPAGFIERTATERAEIETSLEAYLDGKRRAQASGDTAGTLDELTRAVAELLTAGGKRLRPALVLAAYAAAAGDPARRESAALPVALATEMLQAYLLIHDDIMDRAELRRGRPAVHAALRDAHRDHRWPGDSADHGRSMAILAGDLAHTWAVELYLTGRVAAGPGVDAGLDTCFHAMCEEVIGGQWLEMRLPLLGGESVTADDLQKVLHLKSGRYSVERPLELGARLAGAPESAVATLRRLGAAAGEAFQLQDDLLGVFGDDAELGKSVASDLTEGKITFLIHHALEAAAPEQARTLEAGLGRPDLTSDDVAALRAVLTDTGARRRVESRIEGKLVEAQAALSDLEDELPLTADDRAFFTGLLTYLKERTR